MKASQASKSATALAASKMMQSSLSTAHDVGLTYTLFIRIQTSSHLTISDTQVVPIKSFTRVRRRSQSQCAVIVQLNPFPLEPENENHIRTDTSVASPNRPNHRLSASLPCRSCRFLLLLIPSLGCSISPLFASPTRRRPDLWK